MKIRKATQNVEIKMVWEVRVTQGHRQYHHITIRSSTYDFLFDFNRNYASIMYRFRVITSYLSKVADFKLPRLHLKCPLGVTPFEFHRELWLQKTRVLCMGCRVALFLGC